MNSEGLQMLQNALLKPLLHYAAIFCKGYYVTHKYSLTLLALTLQVMHFNLTKGERMIEIDQKVISRSVYV